METIYTILDALQHTPNDVVAVSALVAGAIIRFFEKRHLRKKGVLKDGKE